MKNFLKELFDTFSLIFFIALSCGVIGGVVLGFKYAGGWIIIAPFIWYFSTKKAITIMFKLSKNRKKEFNLEIDKDNLLLELNYTKEEWLPFIKDQKKKTDKFILKSGVWVLLILLFLSFLAFEELAVALIMLNFTVITIGLVYKTVYKTIFQDYRSSEDNYTVKFYLQGLTVNNENYIYNKYIGLNNSFEIKNLTLDNIENKMFLKISYKANSYFQGSIDTPSGDLTAIIDLKIPLTENHKVDAEKLKTAYNIV